MDVLKGYADVVTTAVTQNGSALRFTYDDLKANDEIVNAATEHNPSAFLPDALDVKGTGQNA